MKIADLKKLIENLPDEMEIVVSGRDHSYTRVNKGCTVVKAEASSSGHYSQYWNDVNKLESENEIIEVFWINDGRY